MEHTELDLAQQELKEENHFLNIYKDKLYRGWYKYVLYSPVEKRMDGYIRRIYKDTIARFRLPPTLPIYNIVRKFKPEERLVGVHRMMVGKDLQKDLEALLNAESMNDFIDKLSDEEVKSLTERAKKVVTLNCNNIPYLHIRTVEYLMEDVDTQPLETQYKLKEEMVMSDLNVEGKIKDYIIQQPDYVGIFIDVLNEKISIKEATTFSDKIIQCEFLGK